MFTYPAVPIPRRHGPNGYLRYEAYKPWLRDEFAFRCVYCLIRERWYPNGNQSFSVDHFVPQSVAPSLTTYYGNLVYACIRCNSYRRDKEVLDPVSVAFGQHLRVVDDGTIEDLTMEGAKLTVALYLNDPMLTEFRLRIIQTVHEIERGPMEDAPALIQRWLGFPNDLPNLRSLRPPENSLPQGAVNCYYEQRRRGTLPDSY